LTLNVKKRIARIVGLTADIVKTAETISSDRVPALTTTPDEIKRLWNREYGRALRTCLSRAEVREIVNEGKRKAWPHLNKGAVRLGSVREFAARAAALGADFKIAEMDWPSGLAVLGFYLGTDSGLKKRPLICLNVAHHPAAVATAFLHEVGHHVTSKLFSSRDESIQLSRQVGYQAHLSDPRELAADVLVSLGVFPSDMAAQLFDDSPPRKISSMDGRNASPAAVKTVVSTARRYGLDLKTLPLQQRLQYQAGLVHMTKLRQALLEEYGF
jgi:hypothetical protein